MGSTTSTGRGGAAKGKNTAADPDAVLAAPVSAHKHSITCLKFFGQDNDLLITASEDRTLRIWDFGKEQKFGKAWELHRLQDRQAKAAAKANAEQGLPAMASIRCPLEAHAHEGHQHWVTSCDVEWGGSVVYSGSMDRTIKAWDMFTGRCMRTYSGHGDWVLTVHVRSRTVYSTSEDGAVRLWRLCTLLSDDAEAGAEEAGCWEGHEAAVKAAAQEGDFLLTGDLHGCVKYWNLLDGSCEASDKCGVGVITCLAAPYHAAEREAAERRAEGRESTRRAGGGAGVTCFVGGSSGGVEWREVVSNQREDAVICRYSHAAGGAITCMQAVDGTLFTGSEDRAVRAWGVESGDCVQLYLGHLSAVRAMVVLPDVGLLVTAGSDLRVWGLDSGDVTEVLHWKRFEAVAVGGGGRYVVGACAGQLRCYGIESRARRREAEKEKIVGVMRPLLGTVRPRTPPQREKGKGEGNGQGNGARGQVGMKGAPH